MNVFCEILTQVSWRLSLLAACLYIFDSERPRKGWYRFKAYGGVTTSVTESEALITTPGPGATRGMYWMLEAGICETLINKAPS